MADNPKDLTLVTLAEKGGSDADLLLLDKIHVLEDLVAKLAEEQQKPDTTQPFPNPLPIELQGAELVTIKGIQGDKGEKGDTGDKGEKGDKGDTGANGKDGRDGVDGVDGIDGKDGKDGRDGKDGKDGKDVTPDVVQALEEKLAGLEKGVATATAPRYSIFGGRPGSNVIYFDLSSQLNGSTKTFFLGTHFGIIAVFSSSAPFIFRPTVDYTELGKNIKFDTAIDAASMLPAGQSLIVLCKK